MIRNLCCRWAGPLVVMASFCAPAAHAVEIKLVRHPDYHNGKVVFSYLGDLWTANDDGSHPRRLTVHPARDIHPRFSPDGKWIAFSSDRFGNYDVFVMPAEGGKARQLTYHSAGDLVVGWSRDSRKVIFQSSRGMMFPGIPNLYEVPLSEGAEQPINTDWGFWGSYSPDGGKFAFNRHPMVWWRKHYRGSYAADLWVMDNATQKFRRLVDDKTPDEEKANNFWPMYGNGGFIYFVSDRATRAKSGTPEVLKSVNNIWKVSDSAGEPVQVTHHTSGALFWPSMSSDGKVIVYEENFGLWKLDVASGKSTEIKIDITSDDQENNLETLTFNGECDSFTVSPTGKRAVISVHGELFTIATDKGETRPLTKTPHIREMQPAWSPDGNWIAFIGEGEKDGQEHICVCDEKGGQMKYISTGDSMKSQIRWAPDSSALLYTASDNKLYRYAFSDGKTAVLAASESGINNARWSPDGKWISFNKAGKNMLSHVYVMPAAGGEAKRVTSPETFSDTAAVWTPDGKHLVYMSSLDVGNGPISPNNKMSAQLYLLPLMPEDGDSSEKGIDSEEAARRMAGSEKAGGKGQTTAAAEVKIDFTNMGRRARQLTKVGDNISSFTVSPDSKSVVFVTSGTEGGRTVQSIWSMNMAGGQPTRVVQSSMADPDAMPPAKGGGFGGGGLTALQFAKDGKALYYKQGKSIYVVNMGGPMADSPAGTKSGAAAKSDTTAAGGKKINFVAKVEVDHRAERQQVFLESWRVMQHRFYDAKMHGADWDKAKAMYQPLLQHVADTEELHNVISMMLGELNASHTGISGGGRPNAAVNNTRHPGFDMAPDKSGYYKVTHVYQNGPCDKDYVKLKAGDFILALNEQPLKSGDNYWKAFTLAPPGRFEFMVNSKPVADGAWTVKVTPINITQLGNLQYEKWVAERRAMVDRLSGGEIGYLHIRQMNEPSLRQFERDLAMLSGKKGLVIDQRFNPGGSIDQELLQILQQKQYQKTMQRGAMEITRPLRGFFGPMVVMANERSTSDAEVFPDGFRTLKLGKVVGVTTYGAVIGTGAHQLLDGSTIRTPGSGLWNVNGTNLENNGIVPDVYVDNTPEDFFRRRDAQIEKAVEVLRQK